LRPCVIASLRLFVLASLPASLPAQSLPSAAIDSVFRRFAAPGSPGCALGIARDGELVHSRGYGLASVELGVPITKETVFDIGSVSKQFTAMSVVLLAQDGKLSLDDEIQKYLPEVPRYSRPVTIRHLLHHTSGLRDYIDVLSWSGVADEAVTGDRDALEAIARQKAPNFPAGAEHRYSNSGYFLLSLIVKRAGGESLRDFAARRIFAPLGMTHTQYVDRHEMIVPGKAGSYAAGDGKFVLALANWEQTGDGAVNTTVEDMAKWDRNFVTGTVGGPAGLKELHTVGVLNDGKAITYALGLSVDKYRGLHQVSHGGAWAGFRAHLLRFPDQAVSIFSLCNLASSNPAALNQRVADLILADRLGTREPQGTFVRAPAGRPTMAGASLAGLPGRYRSEELLADWLVNSRGDSLFARAGLGAEFFLRPIAPDSFVTFGTIVTVRREAGGVAGLRLDNRGLRDLRLVRIGDAP
jgi:CubicO group peptidase (beta-lactamase class C family)